MAAATLEFKDNKAKKFFRTLLKNQKDIKENDKKYWHLLQIIAFQDVMGHFEKQKGPNGKWKKWSRLYGERQAKRGRTKILQDSGRMRQMVTLAGNNSQRKRNILLFNPARSKDGVAYPIRHDLGLEGMPKRTFFWTSTRALKKMAKQTTKYMVKGLGK
jgi:hypothetical protein